MQKLTHGLTIFGNGVSIGNENRHRQKSRQTESTHVFDGISNASAKTDVSEYGTSLHATVNIYGVERIHCGYPMLR